MKALTVAFLSFAILVALARGEGALSRIEIIPDFDGESIKRRPTRFVTAHGQSADITRLDFLVSQIALQKLDGSWEERDEIAFWSMQQARTSFCIRESGEQYRAIRFSVGVPPEINRGDPAQYASTHPLHPSVNGLHWGWNGGYVFAAMEGRWRDAGDRLRGFSFHLGRDENLIHVELLFPPSRVGTLTLRLDVSRILHAITLSRDTASSHSRPGDDLVPILRAGWQNAFSVASVSKERSEQAARDIRPVVVAPDATPFRFSYPAHFPRPSLPLDNPLTEEGVALGRELFHDKRLSGNSTQACASCHEAAHGFAEPRAVSLGSEGTLGVRNSMPLMNLAWKSKFFWDGRASSLRTQVLMPIEDPAEMNGKLDDILGRLETSDYPDKFRAAFGTPEISADRLARALEQFLLTLVAGNAKFDKVIRGEAKLTDEEQRGFELFHTEYDPRRGQFGADCFHCHGGPLFQNVDFANNGVGGGPGRANITAQAADEGRFAVPSLRNVTRTAPYMHDGRFATLEQVIGFYDHGIRPRRNLDPNLLKHLPRGLQLSQDDRRALLSFLKTLEEPEIGEEPDTNGPAIAVDGNRHPR